MKINYKGKEIELEGGAFEIWDVLSEDDEKKLYKLYMGYCQDKIEEMYGDETLWDAIKTLSNTKEIDIEVKE